MTDDGSISGKGTPLTIEVGEVVRVVRGEPDEVELAALVAGIVAAAANLGPDEPEHLQVPAWSDHGRRLGMAPQPNGDSWRWSLQR